MPSSPYEQLRVVHVVRSRETGGLEKLVHQLGQLPQGVGNFCHLPYSAWAFWGTAPEPGHKSRRHRHGGRHSSHTVAAES